MSAFEKRLRALADKLGGDRPYCRDCQGEQRIIVITEDPDGGAPTVNGERCAVCGSPDALVIMVTHHKAEPPVPGEPIKPRYAWES
jgi:hypothetical protein